MFGWEVRGGEKWWGPDDFSSGSPKLNLPKMKRKEGICLLDEIAHPHP